MVKDTAIRSNTSDREKIAVGVAGVLVGMTGMQVRSIVSVRSLISSSSEFYAKIGGERTLLLRIEQDGVLGNDYTVGIHGDSVPQLGFQNGKAAELKEDIGRILRSAAGPNATLTFTGTTDFCGIGEKEAAKAEEDGTGKK